MKPFEYVLVIISIIIGLSLAELAIGVSDLIQNYRTAVYYTPYFAAIIFMFLAILAYWATLYSSRERTSWTVPQIGIIFILTLCYYIMAQIGVPDSSNFNQNYEEYFNRNAPVLYSTGVVLGISLFLESYMLKRTRPLKWYLITGALTLISLSAVLIDNEKYSGFLIVFVTLPGQVFNMYMMKTIVKE